MIAVDVTYNCNFRCLHCFNRSGEHGIATPELSDSEILQLVDDISILSPFSVCVCGGEPLLRYELVVKFIETLKNNVSDIQINMVTNGFLMDDLIAKSLKDAGIFSVQVSLDGNKDNHDWLRLTEAYNNALRALKCLDRVGITTAVSFVPTKRNIHEVREVIDVCRKLNVKHFRVQPLMQLGRAKLKMQREVPNICDYKYLLDTIEGIKYTIADDEFSVEWGDPTQHLTSHGLDYFTKNVNLSIGAYGHLLFSPYLPLYCGNIRKRSLIDYVLNDYASIAKTILIQDLARTIKSYEKMDVNKTDNRLPENYVDKSLYVDWIDNRELYNQHLDYILSM